MIFKFVILFFISFQGYEDYTGHKSDEKNAVSAPFRRASDNYFNGKNIENVFITKIKKKKSTLLLSIIIKLSLFLRYFINYHYQNNIIF